MSLKPIDIIEEKNFKANQVDLALIKNLGILSIATPKGGAKALNQALEKSCGLKTPEIAQSTTSESCTALGLQSEQCFLLFPYKDAHSAGEWMQKIGDKAYMSDQSDSWIIIRAKGKNTRQALARICKIDLENFPQGSVTRTAMEHMGAIIYAKGKDEYLLFSARSSAENFWHALKTSAQNIGL